uniref:Reverse transcriptase Ty1/copia-type domain-containing protein n=1 Tax=Clytia hemisphaerica TaxID=252671 RepID=A0A7M5XDS1_9CNID
MSSPIIRSYPTHTSVIRFLTDSHLRSNGYKVADADPCVYSKCIKESDTTSLIIIAVYVDDFTLASNDINLLEREKKNLAEKFDMVDQGEINYILGMRVRRDRQAGIIRIDQSAYLRNVLQRFGMDECRPISTPMETGKSFEKLAPDEKPVNLKSYQAAIGSLIYASIGTRPDLSYSVGVLSQYMSHPSEEHWKGVKRVFRYIQGTWIIV